MGLSQDNALKYPYFSNERILHRFWAMLLLFPPWIQLCQDSGNKTSQGEKVLVPMQWECKASRFVGAGLGLDFPENFPAAKDRLSKLSCLKFWEATNRCKNMSPRYQPKVEREVVHRGAMTGFPKMISNVLEKETSLPGASHSSQERHWGVNWTWRGKAWQPNPSHFPGGRLKGKH